MRTGTLFELSCGSPAHPIILTCGIMRLLPEQGQRQMWQQEHISESGFYFWWANGNQSLKTSKTFS